MDELRSGIHLAARDAELIQEFELSPQFAAGNFASEQLAITSDGASHLVGRFVHKLDAKIASAELNQLSHVLGARLRAIVEHGIAAARISFERQFRSDPVA